MPLSFRPIWTSPFLFSLIFMKSSSIKSYRNCSWPAVWSAPALCFPFTLSLTCIKLTVITDFIPPERTPVLSSILFHSVFHWNCLTKAQMWTQIVNSADVLYSVLGQFKIAPKREERVCVCVCVCVNSKLPQRGKKGCVCVCVCVNSKLPQRGKKGCVCVCVCVCGVHRLKWL